jgi:hypothetical protein
MFCHHVVIFSLGIFSQYDYGVSGGNLGGTGDSAGGGGTSNAEFSSM